MQRIGSLSPMLVTRKQSDSLYNEKHDGQTTYDIKSFRSDFKYFLRR